MTARSSWRVERLRSGFWVTVAASGVLISVGGAGPVFAGTWGPAAPGPAAGPTPAPAASSGGSGGQPGGGQPGGSGPTPSPQPTPRCPDAPEEGQYTRDGYDITWIVYELVPCDREILSGSGTKNDGDTKGSLGVQEYWSYRDGQWKRDGFWGGVTETRTTGDPRFDHDIETRSWRIDQSGETLVTRSVDRNIQKVDASGSGSIDAANFTERYSGGKVVSKSGWTYTYTHRRDAQAGSDRSSTFERKDWRGGPEGDYDVKRGHQDRSFAKNAPKEWVSDTGANAQESYTTFTLTSSDRRLWDRSRTDVGSAASPMIVNVHSEDEQFRESYFPGSGEKSFDSHIKRTDDYDPTFLVAGAAATTSLLTSSVATFDQTGKAAPGGAAETFHFDRTSAWNSTGTMAGKGKSFSATLKNTDATGAVTYRHLSFSFNGFLYPPASTIVIIGPSGPVPAIPFTNAVIDAMKAEMNFYKATEAMRIPFGDPTPYYQMAPMAP